MIIKRSEALDVLRKWFTEESRVRCEVSFSTVAFSMIGKIIQLTETEIKLMSRDGLHETALLLTPKMEFGYGDFRKLPEEGRVYEAGIVAYPDGPGPAESDPDTIAFSVLKNEYM